NNRYKQQFKDDKKNGKGTFVWAPDANGASRKYTGDWIDGVRTGQGVYVWANGDRYELRYSQITQQQLGQFKDDKKNGKGTFVSATDANGASSKYKGDWIDGVRTGQGVFIWANGDRYEGQWKDDKIHGRGKLTYANGTIKEGMWSNGTFVG
ncbi:unnamed protein product, partial [Rotaria sp. Silwood2]